MNSSSEWKHIPDSTNDDLLFMSIQTTEHYTFQVYLHYRCVNKQCSSIHMYAGSCPKMGCFSLSMPRVESCYNFQSLGKLADLINSSPPMPFHMKNNYSQKGQIAHLSNIKRIRSCLYKPVTNEIWEKTFVCS